LTFIHGEHIIKL